jgi:hypothetical protein
MGMSTAYVPNVNSDNSMFNVSNGGDDYSAGLPIVLLKN